MEMAVSITVSMACGCSYQVDGKSAPICAKHNETRVQSVKAPAPRIVAVNCQAAGPHVVQR